jgi:hypothetical protein
MKSLFRKLILKIKLAYIAWFVSGALIVEAINYFMFKRSITPAGVSSTIAAMALMFTIYGAFKVKEWSEQKMNEKAFKQTETILEALTKIYVIKNGLITPLAAIKFQDKSGKEKALEEIKLIAQNIEILISEIQTVSPTLGLWGVNLSDSFSQNLNRLYECLNDLIFNIRSFEYTEKTLNTYTSKDVANRCIDNVSEIDSLFREIFTNSHYKLFSIQNRIY